MDRTDKFDRIPDDELLTLVQRNTFNYFWKLGHETSGMARERNTSQNTVTTGGTGFGIYGNTGCDRARIHYPSGRIGEDCKDCIFSGYAMHEISWSLFSLD